MRALFVCVVVACGSAAKPPVAPAPVVVAQPAPVWPVPMRIMTWTADGLVEVGRFPDAAPAALPTTPWFVEPVRPIDVAMLRRIVVALRSEHVPGLALRGQPVDRAWLAELTNLPELTALVLDDTDVDGEALAAAQLSLRRLYLARTRIDDAALVALAKQHPLEVIDVEGCTIGDVGLAALATVPTLRAVNAASTRITDAGGAQLGKLPALEVVDLGRTRAGVKTVTALAGHALHQLFLDKTYAGRAIAKLAGMAPRIERVDFSMLVGYRPTDADVAWLAAAPNLVEIGLSQARVTDALVAKLAVLPRLENIRLAGTPVTTRSIEKLVRRELEQIDLAETAVTDANAAALLALPNLVAARFDKTALTDAGLAPAPLLRELYLSQTKVTDAGLAILDAMPQLEALGLGDTVIGDPTLARIVKLGALATLVLSDTRGSEAALVELGRLKQLERLYLDDTAATSAVISALHGAPLRVLHLAGTVVNDDALLALRSFTRLDELTLGETKLRTIDVSAWPRLHTLSLVSLELTDDDLPALAKARRLQRLDLSNTDITTPAPLATLPLVELGLSMTSLSREGKAAAAALAKRGVIVVR